MIASTWSRSNHSQRAKAGRRSPLSLSRIPSEIEECQQAASYRLLMLVRFPAFHSSTRNSPAFVGFPPSCWNLPRSYEGYYVFACQDHAESELFGEGRLCRIAYSQAARAFGIRSPHTVIMRSRRDRWLIQRKAGSKSVRGSYKLRYRGDSVAARTTSRLQ